MTSIASWLASSVPATTQRAYLAAWRRWEQWSAQPLPADGVEIATYVMALSERGTPNASISVALAAIRRAHLVAGEDDPTKAPAVILARGAARKLASTERPQRREDCPPERLRAWVHGASSQACAVRGARDVAILLLGWWGALRRAELASLQCGDVRELADGLVIHVVGKGGRIRLVGVPPSEDSELCPVRAWLTWAAFLVGDAPETAAFRSIRDGAVTWRGISAETVRECVKRGAQLCGDDATHAGPHSLRVGIANALFRAGASLPAVQEHCGWACAETALRYHRSASILGPENPARGLLQPSSSIAGNDALRHLGAGKR